MKSHSTSNNDYILAAQTFSNLRVRAMRDSLLIRLRGCEAKLDIFPEHMRHEHPNRRLSIVRDIRIDQIVGTLNRITDFDNEFRPLGNHLLERWSNVFVNLDPDSWPPILLHQVGEKYYVEDGHHRISVARSLGMIFIQAKVWEYPMPQKKESPCIQICCQKEKSKQEVCVAG
jgi:hypothetical protein